MKATASDFEDTDRPLSCGLAVRLECERGDWWQREGNLRYTTSAIFSYVAIFRDI